MAQIMPAHHIDAPTAGKAQQRKWRRLYRRSIVLTVLSACWLGALTIMILGDDTAWLVTRIGYGGWLTVLIASILFPFPWLMMMLEMANRLHDAGAARR